MFSWSYNSETGIPRSNYELPVLPRQGDIKFLTREMNGKKTLNLKVQLAPAGR
jgi:hypothetical protein